MANLSMSTSDLASGGGGWISGSDGCESLMRSIYHNERFFGEPCEKNAISLNPTVPWPLQISSSDLASKES